MSKVYVLSEKEVINQDTMEYSDWKIVGVITDFVASSAFISKSRTGMLRKWESANFNDPELLDRIAKEGKQNA